MRNNILLTFFTCLNLFQARAQFSTSDIEFWVGSGPDTAVLVIDFLDATEDTSYAWGYLFDAANNVTAETMLSDIDAAEPTLSIVASGGFLNDIIYNGHEGLSASPNYWGTWNGSNGGNWVSNLGLGEVLANGSWFGCSYTDFNPALEPGEPLAAYASTWFTQEDVTFWVGTGSDSAVLVVDFVQPIYGEVVTFAWGVAFDGSTTGEDMLTMVATADANFTVDVSGGFLNDIIHGSYEGIAGMPYYWGTWSGTNLTDWTMNLGIGTTVNNGDWFGCTYDAWVPRRPYAPIAATDPGSFTANDVIHWEGTGSDSAVIVIDFSDGMPAVAFGYLSDGTATAEDALNDLTAAYGGLTVDLTGGFLNSVEYDAQSGIGGTGGFYWGTWSGTNTGNWIPNTGVGEVLSNGDWFGCSFTDFDPATPPTLPNAASAPAGIFSASLDIDWTIYPADKQLNIRMDDATSGTYRVFDLTGNLIAEQPQTGNFTKVDLTGASSAIYTVQFVNEKGATAKRVALF